MKTKIGIGINSYGFTRGPGEVHCSGDALELEGVSLKAQSPALRGSLTVLFLGAAAVIFLALEWFLIWPNFGDIIKGWGGWFTQDPTLTAIRVINLVKMGLGVLFLFVLPLLVSLWLADKLVNPVRLRFSTPSKASIPYGDLSAANFSPDGKLEVGASMRDGSGRSISMELKDASIPLEIMRRAVTDLRTFSRAVGAGLEQDKKGYCLLLQIFGTEYRISQDEIVATSSGPERHASLPSLAINYVFQSLFNQKKNKLLSTARKFVEVSNIDKDHFKFKKDMVDSDLKGDPSLFRAAAAMIGGTETAADNDNPSFAVAALPNVPLLLEYKSSWGEHKIELSFCRSAFDYFGRDYMKTVCETALDLLRQKIKAAGGGK